jgi:hypothetical protein
MERGAQAMERDDDVIAQSMLKDRVRRVDVRPIYSQKVSSIEYSAADDVAVLKHLIANELGVAQEYQALMSPGFNVLSDGVKIQDIQDDLEPILLRTTLAGGASGSCGTIQKLPEALRGTVLLAFASNFIAVLIAVQRTVHILCWRCGLQNFPDFMKDDWCTTTCCCLHSECGCKEWKTIQLFCCLCKVSQSLILTCLPPTDSSLS